MLYKFHIKRLAKFRQLAILAIFVGYFGYFLRNGLFLNSMIYHFRKPMVLVEKWPNQIFWQIDLDVDFVKKTCGIRLLELISRIVLLLSCYGVSIAAKMLRTGFVLCQSY